MEIIGKLLKINRCPHCQIHHPKVELKYESGASYSEDYNTMIMWKTFECDNCHSPINTKLAFRDGRYEIDDFLPKLLIPHRSIPNNVKHLLNKAIESQYIPESCILLCNSSIDAMLQEIGFKEGNMYSRIIKACDENKITESMEKWSHKIRLDSNAIRHPDKEFVEPSIDEAQNTLEFTFALAEFLFVIPYKMSKTK